MEKPVEATILLRPVKNEFGPEKIARLSELVNDMEDPIGRIDNALRALSSTVIAFDHHSGDDASAPALPLPIVFTFLEFLQGELATLKAPYDEALQLSFTGRRMTS